MPKFNMKVVILISFGFFAFLRFFAHIRWAMPYILKTLLPGQYFLIGFLITINNIAGVFTNLYTGNLSDRTHSPLEDECRL